jgi:hypothetical protein
MITRRIMSWRMANGNATYYESTYTGGIAAKTLAVAAMPIAALGNDIRVLLVGDLALTLYLEE